MKMPATHRPKTLQDCLSCKQAGKCPIEVKTSPLCLKMQWNMAACWMVMTEQQMDELGRHFPN